MRHVEEEELDIRQQLSRALLAAVLPSLHKLAKAARGEDVFGSDHELRACVAMSRLAPLLFLKCPPIESEPSLAHPDHSEEEVLRLLDIIEGKTTGEANA
jgi:hypothetical protein